MSTQPSDLVPPTERERARAAFVLGAILGAILALFARGRRRR